MKHSTKSPNGPLLPVGLAHASVPKSPLCIHSGPCPNLVDILNLDKIVSRSNSLKQQDFANCWLILHPSCEVFPAPDDSWFLSVPELIVKADELSLCTTRMAFMRSSDSLTSFHTFKGFTMTDKTINSSIDRFIPHGSSVVLVSDSSTTINPLSSFVGPTNQELFDLIWPSLADFGRKCALGLEDKILLNKAALLPIGRESFPFKFFTQEQVHKNAAKELLSPELYTLPSKELKADYEARLTFLHAISGFLSLDLIKSVRDDSALRDMICTTARLFYPAAQVLLKACVKARINLRRQAFSQEARRGDIVKNLLTDDILCNTLFPESAKEKIITLIGPTRNLRSILKPSSTPRHSSTPFRAKSSRDAPSSRFHPYKNNVSFRQSGNQRNPTGKQAPHSSPKPTSSQGPSSSSGFSVDNQRRQHPYANKNRPPHKNNRGPRPSSS